VDVSLTLEDGGDLALLLTREQPFAYLTLAEGHSVCADDTTTAVDFKSRDIDHTVGLHTYINVDITDLSRAGGNYDVYGKTRG
jgi:hypothetical protein